MAPVADAAVEPGLVAAAAVAQPALGQLKLVPLDAMARETSQSRTVPPATSTLSSIVASRPLDAGD